MTVAVVDLKCANLASVRFALDRLGAPYAVTQSADVIAAAERVILPGVGSARFAADQMDALDLRETLQSLTQPVLGICLGMQLLFERSAEGDATCIGLLAGEVTKLAIPEGEPWPHMGWSRLNPTRAEPGSARRFESAAQCAAGAESRLMRNVEPGAYAYFVHGYAAPVTEATAATAEYGATFAAVVEQGNVYGCQFHPERSSAAGAAILANFLSAPC